MEKTRVTKNWSKKAQNNPNLPKTRPCNQNEFFRFAGNAHKLNNYHLDFSGVPCMDIFLFRSRPGPMAQRSLKLKPE